MKKIINKIPVLGIIVPCYNEEDVLPDSMQKLSVQLKLLIDNKKIEKQSFICFIDDGSIDNTWKLIEQFATLNNIKGIKLSNNFGHQNALLAGLLTQKSNADCLVTIDADLQDDPGVIEQMIDKYLTGNMIVYGVRDDRKTDTFLKRNSAYLFYRLMRYSGIKVVYNHADFRLASRQVIESLERFNEVNLFLRGIFPLLGYQSDIVFYTRRNRKQGVTKYPFRKMLSFAWQGITSFNTSLLRYVTITGVFMFGISILIGLWVLVTFFTGKTVQGWTSILLIVSLFSGINMICLGLIGEYIGKIFLEVKHRPRFIVEKTTDKGS